MSKETTQPTEETLEELQAKTDKSLEKVLADFDKIIEQIERINSIFKAE